MTKIHLVQKQIEDIIDKINLCFSGKNETIFIIGELNKTKNDKKLLKYLTDKIIHYESLFNFTKEINNKLNWIDLENKISEKFAEIDLAKHILREFDTDNYKIDKLLTKDNQKQCDFLLTLNNGQEYLFESKYIRKINFSKINSKIETALNQINETNNNINKKGIVWIFTYDITDNGKNLQLQLEKYKNFYLDKYDFSFNINLQSYSRGLYGDCTLLVK